MLINSPIGIVYIFVAYIIFTFSLFAVVQGWYTIKDSELGADEKSSDLMDLRFRQEVWFSFLSFFSKVRTVRLLVFTLPSRSLCALPIKACEKLCVRNAHYD